MNFCKDCKYHNPYDDRSGYGDACSHPNFIKFDYVSGGIICRPECNTVRKYEPECKLFEKKETFWEWLKDIRKGFAPL